MKDLAMHILDIVQNSIAANATEIAILMDVQSESQQLVLKISDNGRGIPENMLESVTDAFVTSRTTRKVGLGLPLFKMNAERTGGALMIESKIGSGTSVKSIFRTSHPDCLPYGDIAGTMALLIGTNQNIEFNFSFTVNQRSYAISTTEIKQTLDGVSVSEPRVIRLLKEMINENMLDLQSIKT